MLFPFTKKSKEIIAPRLLFFILIFSGIVTLLITLIQLYIEYQRNIDTLDNQFKKIEIILVKPLGQALWFMNEDSLKIQLEGILNFSDIEYLELTGEGSVSIIVGKKVSKHTIQKVLPLTYNDDIIEKRIGSLAVVASTSGIYSRLLDHLVTILISQAIKTFLVSIFIFLIVHHLVTKHLSFISSYLKNIDIQKSTSKLALKRKNPSRTDELDQVTISINEMVSRQKESYNMIEQVVQKRTSELIQKNDELNQQKEKAQSYLDTAGVMLTVLNSSGEITLINKQGCRLLKTSEAEAIGKNWFDHYLPKRMVTEVKGVFENIKNGNIKIVEKYENSILTSDGDERIVAFHNTILTDEKGEIEGILFSGEDITDQRKLETQLQQAQKMESIGTLTGGIAHDFNNLLYMIVGNTDLALEDIPKWNPAYTNLEEVKSASLRAAGIVKQLLNFSRKTDEKLIPIDAVTVIKDSLRFLRSTIPTTVEIHEHMPDDEIIIFADSTQINQIMMNLCINASQAMEETGGTLKINIEKTICEAEDMKEFSDLVPGNFLKITVNDTGPGISPEIINRIFDPYFTTKEMGKGSGMGLSIVHGIVKNHNGAISVDSNPGKGTTFSILIPVIDKKPELGAEIIDKIPRGHEKILFVDDEESITKMTEQMLERLGYLVETSLNPIEAVDLFQSKPEYFDLVITDMTMPQMTGAKLSEKLIKIRSDIPVIICTGHSSLIDEEKAKRLGIASYVMKPASMSTIAKSIRNVLDK